MKRKLLSVMFVVLLAATVCLAGETPPRETGVANVRDHGAKGDGKTDDTAAFQTAIDSLKKPMNRHRWSKSGGVVYIPGGHYVIENTLDFRFGGIRVEGAGTNSYRNRACWIEYRGGPGPLFRFPYDAESPEGFVCRNITLTKYSKFAADAFELWTGPDRPLEFRQNLSWENVGIFHFRRALVVTRKEENGNWQVGTLRMYRCDWSLCRQAIVFSPPTSCNLLDIASCVLRQCRPAAGTPAVPAVDIRAFSFTIEKTNLEGSPFALLVHDSEAVSIRNNFFEGVKDTAVRVTNSSDVSIEGNRYYGDDAGKIQCENVTRLTLREPEGRVVLKDCDYVYWPSGRGTWRGAVSTRNGHGHE